MTGVFLSGLTLLAACGGSSASAGATTDPIATTEGYMKAIEGGDANAGVAFLEKNISDGIALTGDTSASKFMAANKGAKWSTATVNFADPGSTTAKPTKKACLVTPPQGGQICIVTVQVDANGKTAYFHFTVESRYDPGWRIIDVDQVDQKPDNLLPSGNEAHLA